MTEFVLDNSVAMRWFFETGSHSYADAILDRLTSRGDQAIVPSLWPYEVSAVLSRAVIKTGLDAQKASDFIDDVSALPIVVENTSDRHILTHVHRLAILHRLTSYDAAYLEIALRRNLSLATLDVELITASSRVGVKIC